MERVVRPDLERDERHVPMLKHRNRLRELRALRVRTTLLRDVHRARALAGTAELVEPQIRRAGLLELEDLLRVAAVHIPVRLEARRERIAQREVRPPRRRLGARGGRREGSHQDPERGEDDGDAP
jgi:hypothetical protein